MPLGIGLKAQAGLGNGAFLANAGEHVLQRPAFRTMIEDVIAGDHRGAGRPGHGVQAGQSFQVSRAVGPRGDQPRAAREIPRQSPQCRFENLVQPRWRHDQNELAVPMGQKIGGGQVALALFGAPLAHGEQAGQTSPRLPVGGIAKHAGGLVGEVETTTANHPLADRFSLRPGAHHPGQGVAVSDADGRQAQRLGSQNQLGRMRRPAQKAVIGGGLQFGVGHPNRPCSHHLAEVSAV